MQPYTSIQSSKYLYAFKLWLITNFGLSVLGIPLVFIFGGSDVMIGLLVIGIAWLVSLPSLIVLLVATSFISTEKSDKSWYLFFLYMVLAINLAYFIIVPTVMNLRLQEFGLIFPITTIGGLVFNYLLYNKKQKAQAASPEPELDFLSNN